MRKHPAFGGALCYTSPMSWAARRRLLILLILGGIIAALVTIISAITVYDPPSCFDGIANQDETGVDCGGVCPYLCTAQKQPPTVLFTKAFTDTTTGRTVVVASVENKNSAAAANDVPYRLTVYGAGQTLIQSVSGTFDLPPGAAVTVFASGIASGKHIVSDAFLELDPSTIKWFALERDPRIVPSVSNIIQSGTADAPRIEAFLSNESTSALTNVRVVVLVRNVAKELIAASETIVPRIPPQGTASAIFTWNEAFSDASASIEVMPIISLPDRLPPPS